MKAFLFAAAAASLLTGPVLALAQDAAAPPAPPAAASPPDGHMPSQHTSNDALGPGGDHAAHPGAAWSLEQREQWLQQRLDQVQSSRTVPVDQVAQGRAKLDAIRGEQAKLTAQHGGLTQTDHIYLNGRLDQLNASLGGPAPWGA